MTAAIETGNHYFFNSGPLGLDWLCSFADKKGMRYNSLNQYYYYQKALFFGDLDTAEKIFNAHDVREQRRLARNIKPINETKWEECHAEILKDGCLLKFTQNRDLASFLKAKSSRPLIYCSRQHPILGKDIDISSRQIADIQSKLERESGINTLGNTLKDIADELEHKMGDIPFIVDIDKQSDLFTHIAGDFHFVIDIKEGTFTSLNRIVQEKQKQHGPAYTIHTLLSTFAYISTDKNTITTPLDNGKTINLKIEEIPKKYLKGLHVMSNRNVHAFVISTTSPESNEEKAELRKRFYYYVSNTKFKEPVKATPLKKAIYMKHDEHSAESTGKESNVKTDFHASSSLKEKRRAVLKRKNRPLPPKPHKETAHEAMMRERREEIDRNRKERIRKRLKTT